MSRFGFTSGKNNNLNIILSNIKISKYINVKVNISEGQRRKLKAALENNLESEHPVRSQGFERGRRSSSDKDTD